MQRFLNQIAPELRIIKIDENETTVIITCETNPLPNKRVHSRFLKKVKDIPYGNKKVELHLLVRKYFNDDPKINKLTIAEVSPFLNSTGKRTQRLDDELLKLGKEMTSIGCERHIKEKYADVSDSTILRIIKKKSNL